MGNGIDCTQPKYYLSPSTSRALPSEKESSNHFLQLPRVVRSGVSTYLPTYLPTYLLYSASLREFFTFCFLRLFWTAHQHWVANESCSWPLACLSLRALAKQSQKQSGDYFGTSSLAMTIAVNYNQQKSEVRKETSRLRCIARKGVWET